MVAVDFSRYRNVFAAPGAPWFTLAGWLARFPRSTLSLAIILLVSARADGFALASAVSACLVAGQGIAGPRWSRAMDRHGQAGVIRWSTVALVVTSAVLVTAVELDAPRVVWLVAAGAAGLSMCDIGAAARSRWSALTTHETRDTAFAVESVADEAAFIIAPPLLAVVATLADAGLAVALVVALGAAGAVAFSALRASEPGTQERTTYRIPFLPPLSILPVTIAAVGIGGMFGSFDVTAVGWGSEHGAGWLTGALLAAMASGNVVGAVVYGAVHWRISLRRRYLLMCAALGVASAALPFAGRSVALVAVAAGVGLVIGPMLVSMHALVASRAHPDRVTETFAYPGLGVAIGIPVGGLAAGFALDASGSRLALAVMAGFAASIVVIATIGEALLRRHQAG